MKKIIMLALLLSFFSTLSVDADFRDHPTIKEILKLGTVEFVTSKNLQESDTIVYFNEFYNNPNRNGLFKTVLGIRENFDKSATVYVCVTDARGNDRIFDFNFAKLNNGFWIRTDGGNQIEYRFLFRAKK